MSVGGCGPGPVQTLTVQDIDGSPLVTGVIKMKFTNGSVTNDGGGVVTINTSTGDITGSGTANSVAKFTGVSAIGDSLLTDDATTLTYSGVGGIKAPFFISTAANPADAGAIRLGNTEVVAWEKATLGTDWTLGVSAGDVLVSTAPFSALTLTGQGLTSGRVPIISTGGLITDDSGLTYNAGTDTLTAGTFVGALTGNASTASAVAVGGVTGLGTDVATALGVNVGTAGAFVVNGGALGSPSSVGTLPALTLGGTVSGGGNQINNVIIGAVTPLAVTGTVGTFGTSVVTPSLAPTGNITLNQNSVAVATSESSGALVNTLYLKTGFVGIGTTDPSEREGFSPTSFLQIGDGNGGQVGFAMNKSSGQTANFITQAGLFIDVFGHSTATNNVIRFRTEETNSGTTPTERMSISSTGAITLSSGVSDAGGTPGSLCYNTGTFEMTKNNALTCTVSAAEYKTAIVPIVDGLDVLLQMNPSQFAYRDDPKRARWGFVADDLQSVNPRLADGYDLKGRAKSIDLAAISAVAVKAVQELNDKVAILERRILVLSEQG